MPRSAYGPASAFQTSRTPSGRAVAQRRRVSVALLQQAPHGLTAREIREATGFSTNLTASALTGLFDCAERGPWASEGVPHGSTTVCATPETLGAERAHTRHDVVGALPATACHAAGSVVQTARNA